MDHLLLRWLSRESAGLWIAALVFFCGLMLVEVAERALGVSSNARTLSLAVVITLAGLLAAGSLYHLASLRPLRQRHPAPGALIDVGGYRMHIVAEGPTDQGPTIVWIPGGHIGAFAMHHLHVALRKHARSVLLDRPGTGWSDTGPLPRTTVREAEEFMHALERAGERGPFIFAGHSFGGLLAANIARRYRARTHTLVLLDPTPLEVVVLGPPLAGLGAMSTDALRQGFLRLFGIDRQAARNRKLRQEPATGRVLDAWDRALGDEGKALLAIEAGTAGSSFASASIYRELDPVGLSGRAWQTVVYDGDLGDLPVLLVAPKSQIELAVLPESKEASAAEAARMALFFARVRERYLAVSSRAWRIVAPEGTGHNFVYEAPEFVVALMRDLVGGKVAAETTLGSKELA